MSKFSVKTSCPRCAKRTTCLAWKRIEKAERHLYMAMHTEPIFASVGLLTFECNEFMQDTRKRPPIEEVVPAHQELPPREEENRVRYTNPPRETDSEMAP